MFRQLHELDKELFIFFNSLHRDWLDRAMVYISGNEIWLPLYFFLGYLVLKEYRNESWAPFVGVLIALLIADQVTSSIMKPYFQRLRPSRDPALEGLVYIIDGYRGGQFGFASSHAANSFGVAFYFWLLLRKSVRFLPLLFFWAALVSYSRIYLGVHYPGDILAGAFVGFVGALGGYGVFRLLEKRFMKRGRLPDDPH